LGNDFADVTDHGSQEPMFDGREMVFFAGNGDDPLGEVYCDVSCLEDGSFVTGSDGGGAAVQGGVWRERPNGWGLAARRYWRRNSR